MAKDTSFFISLINDRAAEIISENKVELLPLIKRAVEEGKRVVVIRTKYHFSLNLHVQVNNRDTAPYSTGCGCAYCVARHNYAKAKLELHRKTRSFDNFMDSGYYGNELSNINKEYIDKFNIEREEALNKISQLRNTMLAIQQDLVSIDMPVTST